EGKIGAPAGAHIAQTSALPSHLLVLVRWARSGASAHSSHKTCGLQGDLAAATPSLALPSAPSLWSDARVAWRARCARLLALLENTSLADQRHPFRFGQHLRRMVAHHPAQGFRLPVAAAEDGLTPPRRGITSGLAAPARAGNG
ncbi:hypothetical protein, partial [Roseicella aerolata]